MIIDEVMARQDAERKARELAALRGPNTFIGDRRVPEAVKSRQVSDLRGPNTFIGDRAVARTMQSQDAKRAATPAFQPPVDQPTRSFALGADKAGLQGVAGLAGGAALLKGAGALKKLPVIRSGAGFRGGVRRAGTAAAIGAGIGSAMNPIGLGYKDYEMNEGGKTYGLRSHGGYFNPLTMERAPESFSTFQVSDEQKGKDLGQTVREQGLGNTLGWRKDGNFLSNLAGIGGTLQEGVRGAVQSIRSGSPVSSFMDKRNWKLDTEGQLRFDVGGFTGQQADPNAWANSGDVADDFDPASGMNYSQYLQQQSGRGGLGGAQEAEAGVPGAEATGAEEGSAYAGELREYPAGQDPLGGLGPRQANIPGRGVVNLDELNLRPESGPAVTRGPSGINIYRDTIRGRSQVVPRMTAEQKAGLGVGQRARQNALEALTPMERLQLFEGRMSRDTGKQRRAKAIDERIMGVERSANAQAATEARERIMAEREARAEQLARDEMTSRETIAGARGKGFTTANLVKFMSSEAFLNLSEEEQARYQAMFDQAIASGGA